MKIYEIIVENQVNEAGGRLLGTALQNPKLQAALGKGAEWAGKKLGKGDTVKSVKDLYLRGGEKVFNPITKFMKWTGYVASALKTLGLIQMAMEYRAAIARGEKQLAAGKWTQEQFDDYHKNQMGTLITQIALAMPFFLALKVSTGWSVFVLAAKYSQNPLGRALGTTMATMATGVQAAFIQLLNTKENRLAIADFTANTLIDSTIAEYGIRAEQKIKELIGLAEKKAGKPGAAKPDSDKPDTTQDSKDEKPTAPTAPAEPDKSYGASKVNPKFFGISATPNLN